MNPVFDPFLRKMVSGPEAGQNVAVDGFEVNFTGSTTGGVYNAGPGLTLSGNVFSADVADVGFGLQLDGGTASYARYRSIETVTGGTVTLMAGHAYKAYATTSPLTITAEDIPAGKYGQEGHLEIYLANASYVIADPQKVVLRDALEPDSVNNITCRFHDGLCILSVEDHFAGYIVISATGTAAGSLPYAISSASQEYVAFDATTNGAVIDLSGATASGERHLVGNGYTNTILTGSVDCGTSKFTVANLGLSNVQITGGVMTLGDAYIPSGSTVAVSGGLAVEKVSGNMGTLDLGEQTVVVISPAHFSNIEITGGKSPIKVNSSTCTINGCYFHDNGAFGGVNGIAAYNDAAVILSGSTVGDTSAAGVFLANSAVCSATDASFGGRVIAGYRTTSAHMIFSGSNSVLLNIDGSGTVTISSGATIDLTDNTNATPIAPGGGITFEPGGATVYPSAGQASAYSLGGLSVPQLTNSAEVIAGSLTISAGQSATISGANLTSSTIFFQSGGQLSLTDVVVGKAGAMTIVYTDVASQLGGVIRLAGRITIANASSYIGYNPQVTTPLGTCYIAAGATIDRSQASNEANFRTGNGGFVVEGDITYIAYGGESVTIHSGTYTHIYPDGTTEPPQA